MNYWITFHGHSVIPTPPHHRDPGWPALTVLCGDNPPKITDGYAKWSIVDRPLRRGLTIFTGYNPIVMQCEVRFGTWPRDLSAWPQTESDINKMLGGQTGARAPADVEDDIGRLEGWAGSTLSSGAPSVVQVVAWSDSSQAGGSQTNLIPHPYQTALNGKHYFPWIITAIDWGESYRNQLGNRTRQDATITLTNYLNFHAPPSHKEGGTVPGGNFNATKKYYNALLIAGAPSAHSPVRTREDLAWRIVRHHKNAYLKLKGIHQRIKPHAHVWIPAHSKN